MIFKKLWKKIKNIFSKDSGGGYSAPQSEEEKMKEGEVMGHVSMILHDFIASYGGLTNINPSFDYWVAFFTALAYVESSYNPNCVFMEPAPLHYESIGLLQLSTVDFNNYAYPKIDLKNPYENLKFGMHILNKIALKRGQVIFDTNHYWSTLRPGKNPASYAKFTKKLNQLLKG